MASFPLRVRTLYGVLIPEPLASTCSATAQSLSAPRVGFDCETLEQVNVKGVPRQETYKRGSPFRLISAY